MRAFLAVPADRAWRESAQGLVAGLKPTLPRASWTRPEAFHVTLKFLGEISKEAAGRFADDVGARAGEVAAGDLAASGPVMLPPRGRPRVAGVGFAHGPAREALGALAAAAEASARRIGVAPEERPFSPHVTLARLRDPWPPAAVESFCRAVSGWTFPAWRVSTVVLYESRLDAAGAVHTPLREWPLPVAVRA